MTNLHERPGEEELDPTPEDLELPDTDDAEDEDGDVENLDEDPAYNPDDEGLKDIKGG